MNKRFSLLFVFLAFSCFALTAQNLVSADVSETDESVTGTVSSDVGSVSVSIKKTSRNPATGKTTQAQSVPDSFGNVKLGMSVDDVKSMLMKDSQFGYRGDKDVSLMAGENRTLIETDSARYAPYSFLDRCWFQFYEDKLYIMTINMNQEKLDHYSVFSQLCEKYGTPTSLNPDKSEWVSDTVIVALERPLSIKYTDRVVMEKIQNASFVEKTAKEKNREQFLEGL